MKNEIWKPVVGYEGLYEVSNKGRVRGTNTYSHKEPIILSQYKRKDGYRSVNLSKNNLKRTRTVHRLVATAFLPNPDNLEMVNHKDENRENNTVENLEWCTRAYNQNYSIDLHPERKRLFYENFLDKHGKSNSPMLISEARVRTKPIAHLDSDLKIIKIYDNWVEAKHDLKFVTSGVLWTCDSNLNRKNTQQKNRFRKHFGEIFVYLEDEIININKENKRILDAYRK